MILATIYTLILCFIIFKSKLFSDTHVSKKAFVFFFIIKLLPAFFYYYIHFIYYKNQGLSSDSEAIMHDAGVVYSSLKTSVVDYLKILLGVFTESESDPLYKLYFHKMRIWHQASAEIFFNDNRTVSRLHALIMLVSFGHYAVHAVVSSFMSYIGIILLYKTFKSFYKQKEVLLFITICCVPSLCFWTSGVLKESPTVMLLGILLYNCFLFFDNAKYKYLIYAIICLFLFLFLKTYILVALVPCLLAYFISYRRKYKLLLFISTILLYSVTGYLGMKYILKKDLLQILCRRQSDFINMAHGGAFFANNKHYVRFEYKDSTYYKRIENTSDQYVFKKGAKYMYWDITNLYDTLRCTNGIDTVTSYQFLEANSPAQSYINSTIRLTPTFTSLVTQLPSALKNTLLKPFFLDVKQKFDMLVSLENVIIIICFLFGLIFFDRTNVNTFLVVFLSVFCLWMFLLIGYSTPVIGAIVRYRAPIVPFFLMIPLLLINTKRVENIRILNWFKSH